jgi:hypothetical protein
MRLRFAVAASVLCAFAMVAVPGIATARVHHHPRHNKGLTINATPNPIPAGSEVLIYGQLEGSNISGQTIVLYHHVNGGKPGYQQIATATTDSVGLYEIPRPDGLIYTNREWFVRGPNGVHSRTLHEKVSALVSLTANGSSSAAVNTGQLVTFAGSVTPGHPFQRVLLQESNASGTGFHTIKVGHLGAGSNYSINYRFKVPGERDVQVVLPGDYRNIRSDSDAVAVTVQQTQAKGFTINTSSPVTPFGQSVTISGTLESSASSTVPAPQGTAVQLWGRLTTGGPATLVGQTDTSATGTYSFTVNPTANTVYYAQTALVHPSRRTADLWQGVQDSVSMTANPPASQVGGKVTFTGTVLPDKAGDVIYLQRLGADGKWNPVETSFVHFNSTFRFTWRFGETGTNEFRARIYSDRSNVGAASAPVSVPISGLAPVNTLTPVS